MKWRPADGVGICRLFFIDGPKILNLARLTGNDRVPPAMNSIELCYIREMHSSIPARMWGAFQRAQYFNTKSDAWQMHACLSSRRLAVVIDQ